MIVTLKPETVFIGGRRSDNKTVKERTELGKCKPHRTELGHERNFRVSIPKNGWATVAKGMGQCKPN